MLGGGLTGLLLLAVVDPTGQANLDGLTFLVGALIGVGINRFVRR